VETIRAITSEIADSPAPLKDTLLS
jgi:hypothetical protein